MFTELEIKKTSIKISIVIIFLRMLVTINENWYEISARVKIREEISIKSKENVFEEIF